NGGLENDSSFEFAGSFDSKTAGVNFNDVKSLHKSKIFYAQQRYNFFSNRGKVTLTNDSLNTAKDTINVNPDSADASRNHFYLKHSFKYERRSALFTADRFYIDFFENAYYDTTSTYDSLFAKKFYNDLSINVDDFLPLSKLLKHGKISLYAEA